MRLRLAVTSFVVCLAVTAAWSAAAYGYGSTNHTSTSVTNAVVDPCSSTTITGSGFQPSESVTITLIHAPTVLGTATTDSSGSFSASVTIPSGTAPGSYTAVSTGSSGDSASTGLTVGSGGCGVTLATSSSGLAFTGADIAAMVGVAAVAIGLGGMLVLVTRRRRQSTN